MTPDTDDPSADADTLPAAILSLQILEALARANDDRGVTELAADLGLPKPRIYRHLAALKQHGFVAQNSRTSRYSIGWRMVLLGQQARRGNALVSLARPILEQVRERVRYTVVLTTMEDNAVLVLDFVAGGRNLDVGLRVGARFPLHSASQGKVALAFGDPMLLESIARDRLNALTPHTITDPADLRADIARVREQGWADAPEQMFLGINALSVPVLSPDGTLTAMLAAVGSVHYLPHTPQPETIAALQDGARQIEAALGGAHIERQMEDMP